MKDPDAVSLGRRGGLKGGPARALKMTQEERSLSASVAAKARWEKVRNESHEGEDLAEEEKTWYRENIRDKGLKILWIQCPEETADILTAMGAEIGMARGPYCLKLVQDHIEASGYKLQDKPPPKSKGWNRHGKQNPSERS